MRHLLGSGTKRGVAIVAALIVALLAFPALAAAHRRASTAEASAMIYGASGHYYGNQKVTEPRSAPLRCFVADISTVTKGSRWGAWTWSRYAESHGQQCRIANGFTIEHKIGNRWYVFWEGSEGYPPTHKTRVGSLTLMGVPRAVAKDLSRGLSA